MTLSRRESPYLIPTYSLTGDLLAYRRCPRQYRYYNRGALPASRPVQQWFGEFIHGVMEEAYRRWNEDQLRFPWPCERLSEIQQLVIARLAARGLRYRNRNLLQISQDRADLAINTLAPHLFPLISHAEWPLHSVRPMPAGSSTSRADYYEVSGVADVLTSVRLRDVDNENLIIRALQADAGIAQLIDVNQRDSEYQFEILVDYKGMVRPALSSSYAQDLKWQILNYAWLRSQQPDAAPVVAGVLLFINELLLSTSEVAQLKAQVQSTPPDTDVLPQDNDLEALRRWKRRSGRLQLSQGYRIDRAIRVIPVNDEEVQRALAQFDGTVGEIEDCVSVESLGVPLTQSWQGKPDEQTCAVCDWRSSCSVAPSHLQGAPDAP